MASRVDRIELRLWVYDESSGHRWIVVPVPVTDDAFVDEAWRVWRNSAEGIKRLARTAKIAGKEPDLC